MDIQVSAVSQLPIYEQIKQQLREQILDGTLPSGTQLPSIRMLARELKIGVITSKRAYDDLVAEGLLVTQAGKGIYVAELQQDFVLSLQQTQLKERIEELIDFAAGLQVEKSQLIHMIKEIYQEME